MDLHIYNAMKNKYNADIDYHETTLRIYFKNPVAIGEHPQHLEEVDKLLDQISAARDKLESLETFYVKFRES